MDTPRRIVLPHEVDQSEAVPGIASATPALPRFWLPALAARSHGCSPAEAAKSGFRHLELSADPGEIADPAKFIGFGVSRLQADLRHLDLAVGALAWRGPAAARAARSRREALSALRAAVETAQTLGCPLLTIRGEIASPDEKAEGWRYLLDTVYDLESDLQRAGLIAALEAGSGEADALAESGVIRNFLAAAPPAIRLAWDPIFFAAQRAALGDLMARAAHVRALAQMDDEGRLVLADENAVGELVKAASSAGAGGLLAVLPAVGRGDLTRQDLRALCEALGRLLLAAGQGREA